MSEYFQSSASIATSERRAAKSKNQNGDPIELKAKALAVLADGTHGVFVACADGLVRQVSLSSREAVHSFTGANAPLTSLAEGETLGGEHLLLAGCWDKSIHSWNLATRKAGRKYTGGHVDFVKCVVFARLGERDVIVSGGSDASVIIWDVQTGNKLSTLSGHARGVLDLAIDPLNSAASSVTPCITLFSADSVREIRQWTIGITDAGISSQPASMLLSVHETSVNKLCFEASTGADDDADLWTASADKTAKHLVRSRAWQADTTLEHPDFVKDVVVAGVDGRLVVTACRDEEVRVWDASTGKLVCIYSGHYDEVTGLAVVDSGRQIVSVSLDASLRVWNLDRQAMDKAMRERETGPPQPKEEGKKEGIMTAEEEAELAELMDSD